MSAVFYIIGSTIMFVFGFMLGNRQGWKEGNRRGVTEGVKMTLEEIHKAETRGLRSSLDWETTQRLLDERISKN